MSDEDVNEEEAQLEGEEGEGEEGEGDGEGGDNKKLIIIIAAALVLVLGIGAGLFFSGMLDGLLGKKPAVEEVEGEEGAEKGEKDAKGAEGAEKSKDGKAAFLEIPTMVVNLNTDDGVPRYLRLGVQLELASEADRAAVEAVIPRVVDRFQTYLRELRVKDLRGSSGIYRLQIELLWRVNQAAAPVEVKDVLFQEILIQ